MHLRYAKVSRTTRNVSYGTVGQDTVALNADPNRTGVEAMMEGKVGERRRTDIPQLHSVISKQRSGNQQVIWMFENDSKMAQDNNLLIEQSCLALGNSPPSYSRPFQTASRGDFTDGGKRDIAQTRYKPVRKRSKGSAASCESCRDSSPSRGDTPKQSCMRTLEVPDTRMVGEVARYEYWVQEVISTV